MNEVEQNLAGNILCVPYQDNGKLGAIVFNNKGKQLANIDLNKELNNLDKSSKPIVGFNQPMVTACFIKNDDIFISAFHRRT